MSDRLATGFARFVGRRSDADLEQLMAGWRRRPLLWGIFRVISRRLDREAAAGERALVEIWVRGRGGRVPHRRQLLLGRGSCMVSSRSLGEADTVLSFEPVAFLRFVAGQQSARELFVGRRLSVDGSLILAWELPSLFRLPRAAVEGGGALVD